MIPGSGRSAGEGTGCPLQYSWASLVAQLVKNLPAVWETWVQSLGREDPLEKGTATYSIILAWRIPWIEDPVGYSLWGRKESNMTEQLSLPKIPSLSFQYTQSLSMFQLQDKFYLQTIFPIFLVIIVLAIYTAHLALNST